MKLTYDKEADAAYIYILDSGIEPGGVAKTYPYLVGDSKMMINLQFNKENRLIGIEILDAHVVLPKQMLAG